MSRPRSQVGVIAVGSKVSSRDIFWNRVDQFYIHITRSPILFTPVQVLFAGGVFPDCECVTVALLFHVLTIFNHRNYTILSRCQSSPAFLAFLLFFVAAANLFPLNAKTKT